ncbi:MAG: DnaB-like helicase N-terminal domain-containing protein [Sciscionella sp.]
MNVREFTERSLIGVLLLQPERVTGLAEWLRPDDFGTPTHEAIYRCLCELVAESAERRPYAAVLSALCGAAPEDVVAVRQGPPFTERERREHAADLGHEVSTREIVVRAETAQQLQGMTDDILSGAVPAPAPYEVPGADPVAVFTRLQSSRELGDSAVVAPLLHTLIRTAPSAQHAQPERYGERVLEASIRRRIRRAGMRLGQASNNTAPELIGMLELVDRELAAVEDAQTRWAETPTNRSTIGRMFDPTASTGLGSRATLAGPLGPSAPLHPVRGHSPGSGLPEILPVPDAEDITTAEEAVIAGVLRHPSHLDTLTLRHSDFRDRGLGITYQSARDVHQSADEAVDAVTVAWRQTRQQRSEGRGTSVDHLVRLIERPPHWDVDYAADVVLRGSVARAIDRAADSIRTTAAHPGIVTGDVLHTATTTLGAVREHAQRSLGRLHLLHAAATRTSDAAPVTEDRLHTLGERTQRALTLLRTPVPQAADEQPPVRATALRVVPGEPESGSAHDTPSPDADT